MKKRIKLIAMCLIIIMLFCNYFIPIAYAAENLTEDGKNNTEEITENTVENEEVEEEAKEEDVTKEEEKPEEVTTEETTTEEVIVEEKKTEEATKDNENLTESNGNQVEQENKEPEENNTENVEANSKVRAITKSSTNSETDEEVVFADDKLKGYLLENYDANEDGKITQSDMTQITELEIPFFVYNYKTDLKGLEYATSLKRLTIVSGRNFNAISALENLEELIVDNIYSQEDYKVIKEIPNLKKLTFRNIDFNEYSLSDLPKQIEELGLEYGELENIQTLEQFTNLTKLEIDSVSYNVQEFQGLDVINKLTKLKDLTIRNIGLTDIEFLRNNAYIETLNVQGNKITDISIVKTMGNLKNMNIQNNNIQDITVLRDTELLKNAGDVNQSIQITAEGIKGEQIEVELPQTIKSAIDENDSTFYVQSLRIEQNVSSTGDITAEISDDKTKLIIDTAEANTGSGSTVLYLYGYGILAYTSININYTVLANGDNTKEIEFEDQTLKNYILQNHDIDEDGKITEFDMLQIKRLTPGYSTTVTSAKGIEYAKNLEQLHITVNSKWENGKETPANLTSIASLGKLKGLILNGIAQNVDFLANMTNLEQLTITITNTNSDNINLIKNLTNLKYLAISGEIKTLEPLRNLAQLEQLIINGGLYEIKDIEPLSDLSKLNYLSINRYKNTTNNEITEINYSALKDIDSLVSLYITDNNSNFDCSWINTNNLYNLSLEVNSVVNQEEIGKISTLRYIMINKGNLQDMSFVANLQDLYVISFNSNLITDLSPIEGLDINEVYLQNNPIDQNEENNARIIEAYKNKNLNLVLTDYEETKKLEFKDKEFEKQLLSQYDLNRDGGISAYEMGQITSITVQNLEHADKLTNLANLYIYSVSLDAEGQKALISEINKLNENVKINGGINSVIIDLGTFDRSSEKYEIDLNEICPILKEWQTPGSRLYKGELVLKDSYNNENVGEVEDDKLIINRNLIGSQTYTITYGLEENYSRYNIYVRWRNTTTGDNTKEINIQDQNFKNKLLQDYDIDADGKFTEYDANNIGTLNINLSNITSLSGIENFKNLRVIEAYDNNISDLEPLRNLTELIEINLANNKISNIEPIMGLQNLNHIAMSENNITDISCLKNRKFKYVTYVDLDDNYIDFSNDSEQLEIYLNEVLKDIAKYGDAGYDGADVKPLICTFASSQKYGNPATLDNEVNMDSKIKAKLIEAGADLNKDGKLTARELNQSTNNHYNEDGNYITAVVKSLDLSNLGLTDLSGLEYLSGLEELNLSHNQISNIEPLSHLMNLSKLDLSYNNITDISVLPYYADNDLSEKTVNLSHNNIADISSINNWIIMRTTTYRGWQTGGDSNCRAVDLDLSYNQIEDISGVKDYKCLAKLNLSNNKIKDISSLKNYNFTLNEVVESDYLKEQLEDFEGIDVSSNYIDVNSTGNKEAIQVFKNKNITLNIDNQKKDIGFTDVDTNAWYYSSIEYVYNKGIILGTSDTTFNPNTKLTRGMLVTILHRMDGKPTPTTQNKFSDVYKSQYYYDAVIWAAEKGIVHGYDDGTFGPDEDITRQDLAVMIRNFARYKGKNVNVTSDLNKFKDGNLVSDYANSAVEWATGTGVITGNNNGESLTPHGKATRAETAGMMYNYCTKVNV